MTNTECLLKLFPKLAKFTDNKDLADRLNADTKLTDKLRAYVKAQKAFAKTKDELANYTGRLITRYNIINTQS